MSIKTKKIFKSIMASVMVATIASASLVAPAAAAGSFSLTLLPGNTKDAQAMRAGMQIFNLIQAIEADGSINQNGMNNVAGLKQGGNGNFGTIWQEGNGHHGTLNQQGNNNSYGIYQFGENTNVDVSQYGNSQTGATFIFGF
jgi:hypothetical protein